MNIYNFIFTKLTRLLLEDIEVVENLSFIFMNVSKFMKYVKILSHEKRVGVVFIVGFGNTLVLALGPCIILSIPD